jgi:hypothetical protein
VRYIGPTRLRPRGGPERRRFHCGGRVACSCVPRPDLTRGVRVCLSLWRGPAAPGPGERRAMGPLDMDGGDFGLGDLDSGVAALLSGLHCHAAMRWFCSDHCCDCELGTTHSISSVASAPINDI